MKNEKLSISTRWILGICGLSLLAVLFTPIWRIDLSAPQYPEGLSLKIYANDIEGDVAIINGLNHYIGMKTLHKEDFPEFSILPYCIIFFSIFFVTAAIINRKSGLNFAFLLFVAFGTLAMIDFWKWEYNYGHNLDPHAAIVVPGMAYQPPLVGYKQLLNFAAYSIPDIGGWIFIGCGALLLVGITRECMSVWTNKTSRLLTGVALLPLLCLVGCSKQAVHITVGKDVCAFCKMKIVDLRYGGEIITNKGLVYKFDDLKCLQLFRESLERENSKNVITYYSDYCGDHKLVPSTKCFLLNSKDLRCPMEGHIVAFASQDSLRIMTQIYTGEEIKRTLN